MYTPSQVSEMLDIPASSLRRLSRVFSEFLSKQSSRHRHYTEQDVFTLRQVREMTGQGKTIDDIKQVLPVLVAQPAKNETLSLIPSIGNELERLEASSRALTADLAQLRTDHQTIMTDLAQLRTQSTTDRARLERLEAWAALSWWRRLFTPPPTE